MSECLISIVDWLTLTKYNNLILSGMFSNKIISIVFEIQTQPKNGVENDVLGCSYEQQIIGGIQLFAIGY